MDKQIDLSVIIIALKRDFITGCLKSLKPALQGIESEVILIDNASPDRVDELVGKDFPEVKVLRREENGGFGENNNLGIKIAKGRFVLLLNDDTELLDTGILKEMIGWMEGHPKAGIAGCALLNSDKKSYQGSGGYYPTLGRVLAWMSFIDDIPGVDKLIKPYHPMHSSSPIYKGDGFFKREHRQDWVTGAFFLMRKSALDQVGGFDEDFFMYVEEVDLAARFIKEGWQVWYLPKWKILHIGQASSGGEKATIFELQNLVLLYKKHEAAWKVPVLRFILKFGTILRIVLWSLFGKKETAKIYAKAFNSI